MRRCAMRAQAMAARSGATALGGVSSAHQKPAVRTAADDCFAQADVAELTVELATVRRPGITPARGAGSLPSSSGCTTLTAMAGEC